MAGLVFMLPLDGKKEIKLFEVEQRNWMLGDEMSASIGTEMIHVELMHAIKWVI
jgi:hypothetical protein